MTPNRCDSLSLVRLVLDKAQIGGAILDVEALDRALAGRNDGLQIHHIYLTIDGRDEPVERIGRSRIIRHPIPYREDRLMADGPVLIATLRRTFLDVVQDHRPSLFVNHVPELPSGVFLSQLAKSLSMPVVALYHGGSRPAVMLDQEHVRSADVAIANVRATAGLADVMAAVSDSAAALLPMKRVLNVWTGADAAFFDPARVLGAASVDARPRVPTFLLAARIVPEKGHKLLLDASQILFERRVDHRILFVGSGRTPVCAAFERYLVDNGFRELARVVYDATQEQMVGLYAACDVAVLPGYHLEGCPRCLIEAALMERPVIATDSGGTREAFIPGTTGLLVPPGDAVALADAMHALATDPERRAAMGRAGRQFAAARFDLDALAARHEAIYAQFQRHSPATSPKHQDEEQHAHAG